MRRQWQSHEIPPNFFRRIGDRLLSLKCVIEGTVAAAAAEGPKEKPVHIDLKLRPSGPTDRGVNIHTGGDYAWSVLKVTEDGRLERVEGISSGCGFKVDSSGAIKESD